MLMALRDMRWAQRAIRRLRRRHQRWPMPQMRYERDTTYIQANSHIQMRQALRGDADTSYAATPLP